MYRPLFSFSLVIFTLHFTTHMYKCYCWILPKLKPGVADYMLLSQRVEILKCKSSDTGQFCTLLSVFKMEEKSYFLVAIQILIIFWQREQHFSLWKLFISRCFLIKHLNNKNSWSQLQREVPEAVPSENGKQNSLEQ